VVFSILEAKIHNVQMLPKRRMERTYRLDMMLGGMDVDGISLKFNKTYSRNQKAQAETDEIKQRIVLGKVEKGVISPDEGAQEMGYESWYDEGLLDGNQDVAKMLRRFSANPEARTVTMSFDRGAQRYRMTRDVITLQTNEDERTAEPSNNVVPMIVKKKAL